MILGEIYELKAELNSDKRDRKKEAVKKVDPSFDYCTCRTSLVEMLAIFLGYC
jgi:hypothetical protein